MSLGSGNNNSSHGGAPFGGPSASPLAPHQMSFRRAPVTLGLIVFMTVVEVASMLSTDLRLESRQNYAISTLMIELFVRGEMPWSETYRFLSHAALHGFPVHLLMNMAALAILGPPVERALGMAKYIGFFLLVAIGGAFGHWAWDALMLAFDGLSIIDARGRVAPYSNIPLVGASGAIFGVLAADVWIRTVAIAQAHPMMRHQLPSPMSYMLRTSAIILGLNIAISFLDMGISGAAHVGGYIVGLACAPFLHRGERRYG